MRRAAIGYLKYAIDEKSSIGDRWGLAYARHALARLHLGRAALNNAREEAEIGLRLADEIGDPKITSRLRTLLGRVHLEQGDSERATEQFRAALQDAERIASEPDATQAREGLRALRTRLDIGL